MNDLISRQAAIEAVNDVIADYVPTLYGRFEKLPLELALAVKRLPSAQPEIDCEKCINYHFCNFSGFTPREE